MPDEKGYWYDPKTHASEDRDHYTASPGQGGRQRTISADRYGWICSRCGVSHAPQVMRCGCTPPEEMVKMPRLNLSPYGRCPLCNAPGKTRERRPNGNDTCANGCTYPSKDAIPCTTEDNICAEAYSRLTRSLQPIQPGERDEPTNPHMPGTADERPNL
jgi:hypothetical protein